MFFQTEQAHPGSFPFSYIWIYMKKAIFNKTPNLSSFYVFSIDKRQAKGYHVFNTKTKMQ